VEALVNSRKSGVVISIAAGPGCLDKRIGYAKTGVAGGSAAANATFTTGDLLQAGYVLGAQNIREFTNQMTRPGQARSWVLLGNDRSWRIPPCHEA
jgi:hypothetical protein